MSAARQNPRSPGLLPARLLAAGLSAAAAAQAAPVVVDPQNGVAINGFDPVAYFTDAKAQPGRSEMEVRKDGVTWRFRNEGNRAAFADDPDVYMPQFGGYDPVAIARGVSVPGHPMIWLVSGQRLYLFYSKEARAEFAAATRSIVEGSTGRASLARRA